MAGQRRLWTVSTDELSADRFKEINALCEAAFDEPFASHWERVGPGLHVCADVDGQIVSHAMIVDRQTYFGHEADTALDAGYVEHVATLPQLQGHGHSTATMRRIEEIIRDEYALGALGTGSNAFYERLGWETWKGPTSVRTPDGERVRTPDEDGHVMVLRTPRSPLDLDLGESIAIDWRAGESW